MNNQTNKRNCLLLLTILLATHPVYCSDKIRILTEQFNPLNYTVSGEDNGEIVGPAVDLVKAMMLESKLEYELSLVPWPRAVQTIDNFENVLVFSMARSADRENLYYWIGEIWQMKHYLYGLKRKAEQLPMTLDQAKKFKISIPNKDVAHNFLVAQGFHNLMIVQSLDRSLKLLQRERIELFSGVNYAVMLAVNRTKLDPKKLIGMIHIKGITSSLYIALSKKTKAKLVSRLRLAYSKIRSSGQYDTIMQPMRDLVKLGNIETIR